MKTYVHFAASLIAAAAIAVSLPIHIGQESVMAQEIDSADPVAREPEVQDQLRSAIAGAIEEYFQVAIPDDVKGATVVLQARVRSVPPVENQEPAFPAQMCLLDGQSCSELFGTNPKPCLVATQRCESSPRVVLLGSARK